MRRWTAEDSWHFRQGTHDRLYEVLGAFPVGDSRGPGTVFRVWAPGAAAVSVVGDFNDWNTDRHPMEPVFGTALWEVRVPGALPGHGYKFRLEDAAGTWVEKADPFAIRTEAPPASASIIAPRRRSKRPGAWEKRRASTDPRRAPMSIYEVHLGSWDRHGDGTYLGYAELADRLVKHVASLGFTHVELMPVMEHPYDPSWGYQVTGYFAPTARFGSPDDFRALVDAFHDAGIGVILDWVPAHFPTDAHGLYRFTGEAVYEHPDPRRGYHPDWTTAIFDYGRPEVRSFLLSSACWWLDAYGVDGLRFDAVASMLYLDYSRNPGDWLPNVHGGREALDAIELLRTVNTRVAERWPHALMIAEESTAWPGVSKPVAEGGLGFSHKWDMGWMNDTLRYMARDPIHRPYHHDELTFRAMYQYTERFVLPLSHDEVVHGKRSLLRKMPGDAWQQLANLRLLLGSMYGQPGKKLLFMGTELAPELEWNADVGLPWAALLDPARRGLSDLLAALNHLMRQEPALHDGDASSAGFTWIDWSDRERCVLSWLRRDAEGLRPVAVVCNFTPVPHRDYRLGMPSEGSWQVCLDTDDPGFGGSGFLREHTLHTEPVRAHEQPQSLRLDVPPLAAVFLRPA